MRTTKSLVRSRAPLRLSFGGGGSELSPYVEMHGGNVLNATINMHAYTTMRPAQGMEVRFTALDQKICFSHEAISNLRPQQALPLHQAVYNRMVAEFNHGNPLPVEVFTYCDAPIGSGLGASSTLTVSLVTAFAEYLFLGLDEYAVAQLAYEIERKDLGLSGGRQDQYAASFGGFNFIEFRTNDTVVVNPLRMREWVVSELEASLVLYYTGVSRESARIIEQQQQLLRQQDAATVAHLHNIKSIASKMKDCLLQGDLLGFARNLDVSWSEKKATADKISNSFIDDTYTAAKSAGALGGKISGAGGGGFMMLVCDPERKMDVIEILKARGGEVYVSKFVNEGARSWRI